MRTASSSWCTEAQIDWLTNSDNLVGKLGLDHAQESAQALLVVREDVPQRLVHGSSLQRLTTFVSIPKRSSARPTVWSTISPSVFGLV